MGLDGTIIHSDIAFKLQSAGHEIIPQRGTYIDRRFRSDLSANQVVRLPGGTQALLDINGDKVTVGRLLPERAALVLNADATIIEQSAFAERYLAWIAGFEIEHVQPGFEPVPNAIDWLLQEVDPEKDYLSYIPLGFDRDATGPPQKTHDYSPLGNKLDAKERERVAQQYGTAPQAPASGSVASELTQMLADGDISQDVYLKKMKGLFIEGGEEETPPPAAAAGVQEPAGKDSEEDAVGSSGAAATQPAKAPRKSSRIK